MKAAPERPDIVNLVEAYSSSGRTGPLWGCDTGDLNGTYLVLNEGDSVTSHVNSAVDVIMVILTGRAESTIDGSAHVLSAGHVAVLRKGQERAWTVTKGPFSYLNIHRRRVLMPGELPAKGQASS